ncbi:hypothetical protein [Dokdonia pacifica]|uniref:Outer membrane protein beta-barrel domain-containing protein n=1 Tax=Dokdonia pacifica TaxID=1627892 RepID=A0A239C4N8_9FLAO|nr:hypothetical protein [Dokdonia pacifica]SNS14889.1 hypothetical protein SAMN06265376_107114 [Dokdonia pacifica]
MKTICFIIAMSLCSFLTIAQSDSIPSKKTTKEYWDYEKEWQRPKFEIGLGVFLPQGKLTNFINPSPFVDINIYIPAKRNKSISIVVQFIRPSQNDQFVIQNQDNIDQVEAVSSDFIINSFLRFSQNLTAKNSVSKVELGVGVGISSMFVQTPFSFFNDEGENANRGLVSFLVAPGLHWKFQPTENTHITIGADVQYSPYKLKGAIEQDLGGLAILPKVLYRF